MPALGIGSPSCSVVVKIPMLSSFFFSLPNSNATLLASSGKKHPVHNRKYFPPSENTSTSECSKKERAAIECSSQIFADYGSAYQGGGSKLVRL